jgi:hypothetical protein
LWAGVTNVVEFRRLSNQRADKTPLFTLNHLEESFRTFNYPFIAKCFLPRIPNILASPSPNPCPKHEKLFNVFFISNLRLVLEVSRGIFGGEAKDRIETEKTSSPEQRFTLIH